jgi:WD40-like Beta Propeller Repeat
MGPLHAGPLKAQEPQLDQAHLTNLRSVTGMPTDTAAVVWRYGWIVPLLVLLLASAARAAPAAPRAWELATPGPTNGVPLAAGRAWSADGDRIAFVSFGSLPGSTSGELAATGVATRTSGGWTMRPVGVPFTEPTAALTPTFPLATDGELATWLWESTLPLLPGAPSSPDTGIYRRAPDGQLTLLADVGSAEPTFVGTSADLQHAVFDSTTHLLPPDAGRTSGGGAYELAGSQLRLVGVDDAGSPISPCGSRIGDGTPQESELGPISTDGSRIWFTAPDSAACGVPQRVYVRENGATTIEASASACTRADCDAPQDVAFAGATADGAHAFLITGQQLTNDDADSDADVYRFDLGSRSLTRVSAGPPGTTAAVQGVRVRASADGSRVYFLAGGQLVPGAGTPGGSNLYLSDRGTLRFVATVPDLDLGGAQISADGGVLAFTTAAALLPGDTDSQRDVYRYDAGTGGLALVSAGAGELPANFGQDPFVPIAQQPLRSMSADGSRIAFVTSEALTPADHNATLDVYEWAGGDLRLVTSGAPGVDPPAYAGMSADGRSIFFFSDESLLPADGDGGDPDLYVARVGGGFPAPPAAAPECEGDACQGSQPGRIALTQPPTLGYVQPPLRPLRLLALDRRARRQLAATGRMTLVVVAPLAGTVSAVVRARLHSRSVVVARRAVRVRAAGTVRLRVRLSRAARRALRATGVLRLAVVVRHSNVNAAQTLALVLRRTG